MLEAMKCREEDEVHPSIVREILPDLYCVKRFGWLLPLEGERLLIDERWKKVMALEGDAV